MKKAKVLALVLAAAMMLSGIGYALWSESIVLQSTAKTGELNVDFVEHPNAGRAYAETEEVSSMNGEEYILLTPDAAPGHEGDDWNDAGYANRDKIYFTAEDLYPGARYLIQYTVKNNGTVPVVLKSTVIDREYGSQELFNSLNAGIKTPANSNIIKPGDYGTYYSTFEVPNWTGGSYEKLSCTFSISLNFEQVEVTRGSINDSLATHPVISPDPVETGNPA